MVSGAFVRFGIVRQATHYSFAGRTTFYIWRLLLVIGERFNNS